MMKLVSLALIFDVIIGHKNNEYNSDIMEGKLIKNIMGYGETPFIFGKKYKYMITNDGLWHLDSCMVIGSNKTGLQGYYSDMLQQSEQILGDQRSSNPILTSELSKWKNGIIPVDISSHPNINTVLWDKMVKQYYDETGIIIKIRTTEAYYVRVIDGDGCWSWVGRLPLGSQPQELSLGNGCHYLSTYVNILYLTIYICIYSILN